MSLAKKIPNEGLETLLFAFILLFISNPLKYERQTINNLMSNNIRICKVAKNQLLHFLSYFSSILNLLNHTFC